MENYRTGIATAVLMASSVIVLSARTHAPNPFEDGYFYLALHLNAPELCDKISPDTVEYGPAFGAPDMRIRYLQSICFFDLAAKIGDASLCRRVRTISRLFRDGSGDSEDACRGCDRAGQINIGGNYATGLLLGVMGYTDDEIRKVFPTHPGRDESFSFLSHMSWEPRRSELVGRLHRLPDFSKGDAQATRDLYATVPQCSPRKRDNYECERLRCALVRSHDDTGCARELARRRAPWE